MAFTNNKVNPNDPPVSASREYEKKAIGSGSTYFSTERVGQLATENEIRDLLHVVDHVPTEAWLAALIGAAERFAWYGCTGPLQNYLQRSPTDDIPGALGLSQATASAIVSALLAVSYFTPIPAAIWADGWMGRYKTLVIFYTLTLAGVIILFATSLPAVLKHVTSGWGVYTAMVLMSFGSGGVKAAITPFIADQYVNRDPIVRALKSGQLAVTDRELTIRYIYNTFYWMVNIGGLGSLGTTFLERYVGFWTAYLVPLIVMGVGTVPLFLWRRRFVKEPPVGTVLPQAVQAMALAAKGGFKMDSAKPKEQSEKHGKEVPWDIKFVDDLKSGLYTCRIFLLFPIHWLCLNQTFHNLISQAGTMEGYGVPNDAIKSFNPISIIIITPVVNLLLYPFLTRRNINFSPIMRITVGFAILTISLAIATGVQKAIYSAGPCYNHPLACTASDDGRIPNRVPMFVQLPIYLTGGIAEIFCYTTGLEYSYNQAPKSMRSIVQSYWLAMDGIGALLSIAFTPLAKDPHFVVMYGSIAGLMATTTIIFALAFRRSNKMAMEML
ncbi:oligopeptide transporter [Podospora didyma]|uniref:Oligopeptide transporter n=1 Tax=Podospora didyma TaxID=330526 RepID=A0AAE0NQ24_9PEZI|nr:oligopeptide transporter [Podospora didyma]